MIGAGRPPLPRDERALGPCCGLGGRARRAYSPRRELLLADVHATLVSSLHDEWLLLTSIALSKDLFGVRLKAGGEDGFSLAGIAVGARIGIGRAL